VKQRSKAREVALQALYAFEVGQNQVRDTIDELLADETVAEVKDFAVTLAEKTITFRKEIDEIITSQAANWKLERIAVIDKNILRMAISEMRYFSDIPPNVSIDEAIELAKKFSTEKSGSFVNGILDPISKMYSEKDNAKSSIKEK
jgi:N utilization substance protein B